MARRTPADWAGLVVPEKQSLEFVGESAQRGPLAQPDSEGWYNEEGLRRAGQGILRRGTWGEAFLPPTPDHLDATPCRSSGLGGGREVGQRKIGSYFLIFGAVSGPSLDSIRFAAHGQRH